MPNVSVKVSYLWFYLFEKGQRHSFFANCLCCGKVLCSQDKRKECPYCGVSLSFIPDISALIQRAADKESIKDGSVYGMKHKDIISLAERLVAADAGEQKNVVLDLSTEEFFNVSFAKWDSVKETGELHKSSQERLQKDYDSRQTNLLSSLL